MSNEWYDLARARARRQLRRVPWEFPYLPGFLPHREDMEAVLLSIDYPYDDESPDCFSRWVRGEWILPGNRLIPGEVELVIELRPSVGDADIWVADMEPPDIERRLHEGGA